MFQLTDQRVTLLHINVRIEKHGDKDVQATDLKIGWQSGTEVLDMHDQAIAPFLFRVAEKGEGDFDVQSKEGKLAKVRIPMLKPLRLETELENQTVEIAWGIGATTATRSQDLELEDCKIDGFTHAPIDGGSVDNTARIVTHATGILDRLAHKLGSEITISTHPEVPKQLNMDKPAAPAKKSKKKTAAEASAEIFGDGDGPEELEQVEVDHVLADGTPVVAAEDWPFPVPEKQPEQTAAERVIKAIQSSKTKKLADGHLKLAREALTEPDDIALVEAAHKATLAVLAEQKAA